MSTKTKNHGLLCLPLAVTALVLAGCGPSDTSSVSSEQSEESTPSVTDSSKPAPIDPTAIMKIEQSQGHAVLPALGTVKTIIVPLNFSNVEAFDIMSTQTIERQMSGEGTSPYNVEQYFETASAGQFHLDTFVSKPITLEEDSTTIFTALGTDFTTGLSDLLDEVADAFVDSNQLDEAEYDADGDGKIDNLILLHGYPEWNGYWTYGDDDLDSMAASLFVNTIGESDKTAIGAWISGSTQTQAAQESTYQNRIIRTITSMMGVPEYKDTTGDINGYTRAPLGYSDVSEGTSADLNPFTKYLLGWVEPKAIYTDKLTGETTVSLTLDGDDSTLLLAPSETGLFGEYLLIDVVAPSGLDKAGSFTKPGIRIYQVDSRLISGGEEGLYIDNNPDLDDGKVYDFAFTNSGRNMYSTYGVPGNFPLCELLDSTGANRHMANALQLTDNNLFHQGDVFGGPSEFSEFYEDFAFHGNGFNGAKLGLSVEVSELSATGATLKIARK